MTEIHKLKLGDILNNDELVSIFQCSPQGGMRKSNRTNSLVIVSNRVKSIYIDRWNKNILYYTGMGTEGDQSFDFMQNKTLFNSNSNNIPVYLFEVFTDKEYTFIGQVKLTEKPFYEKQPDANNKMRSVCIFPVEVINNNELSIGKEIVEKSNEYRKRKIKRMDDQSLFKLAQNGSASPSNRLVRSKQYDRNEAVAEYAKRLANGYCLLCGSNAPFIDKDGKPFLETHHIEWLSEGGSDTIDNTAALCPNCHRKMHLINDIKDREFLIAKVKGMLQ